MAVQIDELTTTVDVQGERESTPAAPPPMSDELTERIRYERFQRDRERLRAEGYAD